MRIPDQLLHCRYDVNLTLQVADATFVMCELSSKGTVLSNDVRKSDQRSEIAFSRVSDRNHRAFQSSQRTLHDDSLTLSAEADGHAESVVLAHRSALAVWTAP